MWRPYRHGIRSKASSTKSMPRTNPAAATPDQPTQDRVQEKQGHRVGVRGHRHDRRHLEGWLVAKEPAPHEGGRARRDRNRQKGVDTHFRQHQFDGEHDAADRRIEGRGDARARAGGDQGDTLAGRHGDDLPQRRTDGRADLDDWAFASNRRPAANRESRCERFHQRDDRPDLALLVVDGVHHLGHAVALGFGSEVADEEGNDDAADDRRQYDERAPSARRREYVGVIGEGEAAGEKQIVQQVDQVAKKHRPDPRHNPEKEPQQRQPKEIERACLVFHARSGSGRIGAGVDGFGLHHDFRFDNFRLAPSLPHRKIDRWVRFRPTPKHWFKNRFKGWHNMSCHDILN